MTDYKFTIFTPCYNGAKTIKRVFQSVESQTYANFEWIIINDGSRDDSDVVIRELMAKSPVKDKIRYLTQENLGKHRAWNRAAELAESDLFLCADADDAFLPDTLAFYNEKANEIGLVGSGKFCGINTCVDDPRTGSVIGCGFPSDGFVCDDIEMAYKFKVKGEKWFCPRTDLAKKFKFPNVDGPFYPETRIWFDMALKGYKMSCYNAVLRHYYQEMSSLCHGIWNKFNRRSASAKLHHHFWILHNVWPTIFRYDVGAALSLLFIVTPKIMGMYLGGIVVELHKHREIRK